MAHVIDTATTELRALTAALRDKAGLHKSMAEAGRIRVQAHFVDNAMREQNRFGKQHTFWKRMRAGTYAEHSVAVAAIVMPREVAQRRFGGTIKPTGGRRALTIPLTRASYNRSARTFTGLFIVKFKKGERGTNDRGGAFLARKAGKGLELLYALRSSVTQKPDARVLPTDAQIADAAKEAVGKFLARRTATKLT